MSGDELVRTANVTWLVTLIILAVLVVTGAPVGFMAGVFGVGIVAVIALFVAAFRTLREKP